MNISKIQILNLYKNLIKYGKSLKYTDKEYYQSYVRKQFETLEQDEKKIERLFRKGEAFLFNKRLI